MLVLFLLSQQALSESCNTYSCPPLSFKFNSLSTCAYTNSTKTYLQACPTGQSCDLASGLCVSSASTAAPNYPGESCSANNECLSRNCTKSICQGVLLNGVCSDNSVCSPGLRCAGNICVLQIPSGKTGCFDDYDCVNSAGCNTTNDGSPGTCYDYLSVSTNAIVSDCSGGVSSLCKSSECYKLPVFGNYGTCKIATQSVNNLPVTCSSNLNCVGTDGLHEYTGNCVCGYNSNGTAYCAPFNGDMPGVAYYQSWKNALTASNSVCNTLRRFSINCLQQIDFLNKINYATWGFYYYSQIQNNDKCVEKVLTYEYYGPFSFSGLIAVLSGIYLL